MAAGNDTKARKQVRAQENQSADPEVSDSPNYDVLELLLSRLHEAHAVIEVACRSMEDRFHTLETVALRSGVKALENVCKDLNRAITLGK